MIHIFRSKFFSQIVKNYKKINFFNQQKILFCFSFPSLQASLLSVVVHHRLLIYDLPAIVSFPLAQATLPGHFEILLFP